VVDVIDKLVLVVVVVVVVVVVAFVTTAIIILVIVAADCGCLILQARGANTRILTSLGVEVLKVQIAFSAPSFRTSSVISLVITRSIW